MSIKVIRKKERSNSQWTQLEVYLDGEKKRSIYGNDSAEYKLEAETAELKVKQTLAKGVTQQVRDGDTVEVATAPFVKYSFYLMPAVLLLMFAASYFDLLNFWILTVAVTVFIFFLMWVKPLQIKQIEGEYERQVRVVGKMEEGR